MELPEMVLDFWRHLSSCHNRSGNYLQTLHNKIRPEKLAIKKRARTGGIHDTDTS